MMLFLVCCIYKKNFMLIQRDVSITLMKNLVIIHCVMDIH